MASISEIRTALKERLDSISGLHVYATPPGTVNTPAVVIRRRRGPNPATLGSSRNDYEFTLTVITSLANDIAAQDKLDGFLSGDGASAIVQALEADPDLGGLVDYVELREVEADTLIDYSSISYLSADIVLDVGAA